MSVLIKRRYNVLSELLAPVGDAVKISVNCAFLVRFEVDGSIEAVQRVARVRVNGRVVKKTAKGHFLWEFPVSENDSKSIANAINKLESEWRGRDLNDHEKTGGPRYQIGSWLEIGISRSGGQRARCYLRFSEGGRSVRAEFDRFQEVRKFQSVAACGDQASD